MCLNLEKIATGKFLILKTILQGGEWQRVLRLLI